MVGDGPSSVLLKRVEDVLRSASTFSALAMASENTAAMPRQFDSEAGTLLDRVLDTSRLGTAADYHLKDIAALKDWSGAVMNIADAYLRVGSIMITDPDDRVHLVDRNVVMFAPEIGRCVDAMLRLQTLTADVIAATLANASYPDRLAQLILDTGWIDTQSWLSKIMKSTLCLLVIDDLPDSWARDRIAVLAEVAPRAMQHLMDGDVNLVRSFAEGVISRLKDPAAKAALTAISQLGRV
jgi:hypothetical protein